MLNVEKYSYSATLTTHPANLKEMKVWYGYPDTVAKSVTLTTPEGYPVWYLNDNTVYVEVAGSFVEYKSTGTDPAVEGSEHSQPYGGLGYIAPPTTPPNYVVNHQETWDGRPCLNLDSDFDGLENGMEILVGTNPNDV